MELTFCIDVVYCFEIDELVCFREREALSPFHFAFAGLCGALEIVPFLGVFSLDFFLATLFGSRGFWYRSVVVEAACRL